jgi:hypothetical protein
MAFGPVGIDLPRSIGIGAVLDPIPEFDMVFLFGDVDRLQEFGMATR